jgi:SHS2 domain-containing protein
LSYKFLDHATDAIIEVTAKDLKEAFAVAADAEINLTNFLPTEKMFVIFCLAG